MSTSETPERSWPDCGEVQCKQVHDFMDTLLETLGVDVDKNTLAVGKGIQIAISVNELKAKLNAAKAEVEEIRQKLKDPHAVRINLLYGHIAKPDDLIFMHDEGGPYNLLLKSRDAWKKMAGELYTAAKQNWWDLDAATVTYEKLLKEDGG